MTERVEEREKISLFQKRILSILNSKSDNNIWFPYTLPYIWRFLQYPLQGRAVNYFLHQNEYQNTDDNIQKMEMGCCIFAFFSIFN